MGTTRPLGGGPGANNNERTNTLPARVSNGSMVQGPTGRHFKPFDHRKMNPMAGIQEDTVSNEPIYQRTTPVNQPHLPPEVRHTNYNNSQQNRKPVNPNIMEHRDSANFSLASSSDSG